MTKLDFIQADDGWYECRLIANVRNYKVQLDRVASEGKNNIVVKMKIDSNIEPAIYNTYCGFTEPNTIIGIDCVAGATIIIRSLTEVLGAYISDNYTDPFASPLELLPESMASTFGLSANPYLASQGVAFVAIYAGQVESIVPEVIGTETIEVFGGFESTEITSDVITQLPEGEMKSYFQERVGKNFVIYSGNFASPIQETSCEVKLTVNGTLEYDEVIEVIDEHAG